MRVQRTLGYDVPVGVADVAAGELGDVVSRAGIEVESTDRPHRWVSVGVQLVPPVFVVGVTDPREVFADADAAPCEWMAVAG